MRSACVSFEPCAGTAPLDLEAEVRAIRWCERELEWLDASESAQCCGFAGDDAYAEFSSSGPEPPWVPVLLAADDMPSVAAWDTLQATCSLATQDGEAHEALATALLERVVLALRAAAAPCRLARVALVSPCARIPLLRLPGGLDALRVPLPGAAAASSSDGADTELLRRAGMCVMSGALGASDVDRLRSLVTSRMASAEAQLRREGVGGGLGCGALSYAEVCSRGKQRWDMLLHANGERVGGGADPAAAAEEDALLSAVAVRGAWVPLVHAALGHDATCQLSVICSRPGAPAGRWHADGGHSRYTFNGASADAPYALCVFVPLVGLPPPTLTDAPAGEAEAVGAQRWRHGLGCTAFWPGSHRFSECLHLGAAASTRLRSVVSGTLEAGDALCYDYRLVHCGSPNDAEDGERPILQLTYLRAGYADRARNYGYDELWCT